MSNGNLNAKKLLGLIIGSATFQNALNKNQQEREKIIREFIQSLRSKLRTQIDANLPVFYLVDASTVVSSMLDILEPTKLLKLDQKSIEARISVFKYFLSITDPETGEVFSNTLKNITSTKSIPSKYWGGQSQDIETVNQSLIDAYRRSYNILVSKESKIIGDIVDKINSGISKTVSIKDISTIVSNVSTVLENDSINAGSLLRKKFTELGICKISDPKTFLASFNPTSQILVIGQTFNAVTRRVHELTTEALEESLTDTGLSPIRESREGVIGFKAGNFAAAGHSAIRSSSKLIGINTPLAQVASLILALKNDTSGVNIFQNLIINTTHKDVAIDILENYAALGRESLSIGIAFAQSQHSVTNSTQLSSEEMSVVNKQLIAALNNNYNKFLKDLDKVFIDAVAQDNSIEDFIFKKFKMSPTFLEQLGSGIHGTLSGKKYKDTKGTANSRQERKNNTSNIKSAVSKTGKASVTKSPNKTRRPVSVDRPKIMEPSLSRLQILLNASLHDRIKANMGTGNSSDVLNYRTGRFAKSVKVERLSQSRAGMITAFYTYMKNPYATFSAGGRQELPRSRDPKLLISKSIREIAQEQAYNRMRAVLV